MAMVVRYNGKEPDTRKGASQEEYALPFEGAWTVVNGGVDKETSHSWGVLTQRYASDFVVLDEIVLLAAKSDAWLVNVCF